ncbi:MAG: hypothetical protein MHM6MM_000208 [Cercozoa sp. M6MM]
MKLLLCLFGFVSLVSAGDRVQRFSLSDLRQQADRRGLSVAETIRRRSVGQPVIVTDWPRISNDDWDNIDFWRNNAEAKALNIDVKVRTGTDRSASVFSWGCCENRRTTLAQAATTLLAMENKSDDKAYLYGGVQVTNEPKMQFLRDALGDVIDDTDFGPSVASEEEHESRRVQLWLTSRGATTPLHYDAMHNFFVPLVGTKSFLLLPPSQWKLLQLRPRFHLRHRNSGRDTEYSASAMQEVLQKQGITDTLLVQVEPGMALYLPPFWFHHVTSDTASIALASWSALQRDVSVRSRAAWDAPLPNVLSNRYVRVLALFVESVIVEYFRLAKPETAEQAALEFVSALRERLFLSSRWTAKMFDDEWRATGAVPQGLFGPLLELHAGEVVEEISQGVHPRSSEYVKHKAERDEAEEMRLMPQQRVELGSWITRVCDGQITEKIHEKQALEAQGTIFEVLKSLRPKGDEFGSQVDARELLLAEWLEDFLSELIDEDNLLVLLDRCVRLDESFRVAQDQSSDSEEQVEDLNKDDL